MGKAMPVASPGQGSRLGQTLLFARNFLRHPRTVGTIAPSSAPLVRRMLRDLDWPRLRTVVEYGPGVGTVTAAILQRMHPQARLLAIETNAEFVAFLRERMQDPRLTVCHGSAAEVLRRLAEHGLGCADCIISGIPFSTLSAEVRERTLRDAAAALAEGGNLLLYQYTRSVRPYLLGRFRIEDERVEWRNLWPMRLFLCRKLGDAWGRPRAAAERVSAHERE